MQGTDGQMRHHHQLVVNHIQEFSYYVFVSWARAHHIPLLLRGPPTHLNVQLFTGSEVPVSFIIHPSIAVMAAILIPEPSKMSLLSVWSQRSSVECHLAG